MGFQPFLKTVLLDVFQVGFHGPVVRPPIGHEIMERRAWIVTARTTGIDVLVCDASPEPASLDIVVRPVAAAAIAVRGSAGAAIKPAWPILRLFHGQTLLPKFNALRIAFGPDFPASV